MQLHSALSAVLFAAALPAQTVCVRGIVDKAPAISICITNATHEFRCPGLRLIPSTTGPKLDPYVGQVVEVCGTLRQIGFCTEIVVASVTPNVDNLRITGPVNGQIRLGGSLTFDLGLTPGRAWALWFSGAKGFAAVPPFGVLLLSQPALFVVSGFLDGNGKAQLGLVVPNDPSLVGADAHFQAGFVDLTVPSAAFANSDCFAIVR